MKKDKIVYIEWVDSYHDNRWINRESAEYQSVSECTSVGYLLKSNLREVIIFQSKSDSGNVTDIISIPKKAIKSMRYLEDN